MKTKIILISCILVAVLSSFGFGTTKIQGDTRVTFTVQGNGKDWVYLSCGTEPGVGGNYAVAKDSKISITCNAGETLWDRKLKKAITTITKEMGGKTIDLKNYY